MKITEWCSYCENEVEIDDCGMSVCPICGEKILPCSQCDMNEVDCSRCDMEVIDLGELKMKGVKDEKFRYGVNVDSISKRV